MANPSECCKPKGIKGYEARQPFLGQASRAPTNCNRYTSCPDACPTTLSDLSTWLNAIGPDADKLNVLFISIDPERDTSAHLKEYSSSFDPRIRGLTGTGEQIAVMAKEYRVYYKRIQLEVGGYAMDPTAVIYLMDRAGKFVNQISLQDDDKIAIERLRQLAAL